MHNGLCIQCIVRILKCLPLHLILNQSGYVCREVCLFRSYNFFHGDNYLSSIMMGQGLGNVSLAIC